MNYTPVIRAHSTDRRARFALPIDADATVTIGLPGVKITARLDDSERRIARELVIRLADRRVLNARECCDDCIERSLDSLQEIRRLIVDKQVQLSGRTDSTLYLLLEFMAEGIRQFMTFEELVRREAGARSDFDTRDQYFAALEALRSHIYRSMSQVADLADVTIPKIAEAMRYDSAWSLDAYVVDELPGQVDPGGATGERA